jgi:hypothetical protein
MAASYLLWANEESVIDQKYETNTELFKKE